MCLFIPGWLPNMATKFVSVPCCNLRRRRSKEKPAQNIMDLHAYAWTAVCISDELSLNFGKFLSWVKLDCKVNNIPHVTEIVEVAVVRLHEIRPLCFFAALLSFLLISEVTGRSPPKIYQLLDLCWTSKNSLRQLTYLSYKFYEGEGGLKRSKFLLSFRQPPFL